jgi:SAM-dependent methyltransferase
VTATETWPWRGMNEGNAPAHRLLASLLEPRAGERWLDVGTGGGGLAFELARGGAAVVGVDVAPDGIDHARTEAAAAGLDAEFLVADAAALPHEDGSFDGVASAFGVIFAAEPGRAAAELARVCRPGGKLGLTLMPRTTRTAAVWSTLIRHGHPGPHPADWEDRLEELLGDAFKLEVEQRENPDRGSVSRLEWDQWVTTFAPLRELVGRLDADGVSALRAEFERIDDEFSATAPSYVIALGRRR